MNRREALQALVALPAVKSIAVADVKPTDVIVIECDEHISNDTAERIRQHVRSLWPNEDRKVLVLDAGMHLKIARDQA